MSVSHSVRTKGAPILKILLRFLEIERSHFTQFPAHSESKRVLPLVGWHTYILHNWRQSRLFASWVLERLSRQKCIRIASWAVQYFKTDISIHQRTSQLSANSEYYIIANKIAICPGSPLQYFPTVLNCRTKHILQFVLSCRFYTKVVSHWTRKVQLFYWKD